MFNELSSRASIFISTLTEQKLRPGLKKATQDGGYVSHAANWERGHMCETQAGKLDGIVCPFFFFFNLNLCQLPRLITPVQTSKKF